MDDAGLNEVLKNSDEAIIVHSPSFSSRMVLESSDMLKKHKILNLGLVLNKSHEDSVNSIFDMPIIAKFSDNDRIRRSYLLKHPALYSFPRSKVSKEFNNLAKKLIV